MAKEDLRTLSLAFSLVDVGKISLFSFLMLLLHLKQGKFGFYWHIGSLVRGDLPLEELANVGFGIHCFP